MIYIGIDPGQTGAIGVIWDGGNASVYDLTDSHADNVATLNEIRAEATNRKQSIIAVLEKVNAMPKQGVASSFKFGVTFGVLQGALYALGIPFQLVTPLKWKTGVFDSSPRGQEKAAQKNAARDLARRLFPASAGELRRVRDADRAEALLMAQYARVTSK